jgi:tryptophanyl-tRNA synthetase
MERFLTGITTSGTPHLGNYVGSIRPSVRASLRSEVQSFYFLADYHALIKTADPARIQRSTLEIAASWLSCGLDPERVVFYRQSDILEISELAWFLSCVVGKGVLNRAHAYKAAVDKNCAAGMDADADISVGLFMYPVLMGADILMFNAHQVPVGRDQVQHIEMARDMAHSFNHRYGSHFVEPKAVIEDNVATLPGLDGRKMSKSYDNTIPLFAPREQLQKLINGIMTDSKTPGEAKTTEGSALFQMYQAFATPSQTAIFQQDFANGIAWSEAKQRVFERIDQEIAPMRSTYLSLIQNPNKIETILKAGATQARAVATPFMNQLRHAVGLRPLQTQAQGMAGTTKAGKAAAPVFKQYREKDGRFYFKLMSAQGRMLLQSTGFDSPRDAGKTIALLSQTGADALVGLSNHLLISPGTSDHDLAMALKQLQSDNSVP